MIVLGALLVAVAASDAHCEPTVEVTANVGYSIGGNAYDYWSGRSFTLDAGQSFGLVVGIPVEPVGDAFVELLWSHQEAGAAGVFPGPHPFEVDIDMWQIGGRYEYDGPSPRLRPFIAASLGATTIKAENGWSGINTSFSFGLGGGLMIEASDHLGVRLEGRAWGTAASSAGAFACGQGGCWFGYSGTFMWQGEVTAGLVVSF